MLQVLETYVGITVIRTVLKGFEPFPDDLFRTSFGWASNITDSTHSKAVLSPATSYSHPAISLQLQSNQRSLRHSKLCVRRAPFKKPKGWLTWGLLGVLLAPVVIGLTVTALTYSGYEVCLCWHTC